MIATLKLNQYLTPVRLINPRQVSYWRHARECADIGGGVMPGAELKVMEISKLAGNMWVRVELPGRYPPASLKITGEELSSNFRVLR